MCKCFIFSPIDVVVAEDATTTSMDCLQIVCGCCGLFEAQSIVIAIFFLSVFCSKWQLHELYFLEAESAALCASVIFAPFPAIVQQPLRNLVFKRPKNRFLEENFYSM